MIKYVFACWVYCIFWNSWNRVSKIFKGIILSDQYWCPFQKALQQPTFWQINVLYPCLYTACDKVAPKKNPRQENMRCGYKCVPQWLNDRAHCLKCQNVLRVREGLHDVERDFVFREVDDGRRLAGEASTYKTAPSSAMESASGSCAKAPDGVHHWKYGKCYLVQVMGLFRLNYAVKREYILDIHRAEM